MIGDGDEGPAGGHILQTHYLPVGEELKTKSDDGSQKTVVLIHISLFEARSLYLDIVGYDRAPERQQVHLEGG